MKKLIVLLISLSGVSFIQNSTCRLNRQTTFNKLMPFVASPFASLPSSLNVDCMDTPKTFGLIQTDVKEDCMDTPKTFGLIQADVKEIPPIAVVVGTTLSAPLKKRPSTPSRIPVSLNRRKI